jgi:hypothetical protein
LWEDGVRCDQAPVHHGLRRILLGSAGLRVNGSALALQGRALKDCNEQQASALRRSGCNLMLAPAKSQLYDLADVQGFFVLSRLDQPDDAIVSEAANHPSCLGWLLSGSLDLWDKHAIQRFRATSGLLIGMQMDVASANTLPDWVDFVACPAEVAAELGGRGMPLLVLEGGVNAPGVFGTVI